MESSLGAGWEQHSNFMTTKDAHAPLMTAEQETIQKTQRSQGLLKMQRGGASQHAWVISQINQRSNEEPLIGSNCVSKCAKETTDAKEKQAVDSKLLLQDRKRWVVTMTHTLTHTVTHAVTHTHTPRSIRVGYMSDPNTQVHDVQLTSDSQLIGQRKMMDLQ